MLEIEYISHYEAGFFAPDTFVEPSPESMGKLLSTFKKNKFLPTTTQLMKLGGAPLESRLQLKLITTKGDWVVHFEPHRLMIKRADVPGVEMCTAEDFIPEATDIISRLIDMFSFQGTRLSYATKVLLKDMPEDELQRINSKLLNLPHFYSQHPPIEWTTKNVARDEIKLNGNKETINVITEINRIQGSLMNQIGGPPFDRIEIGFDINTFQGNTSQRFIAKDMDKFLKYANTISKKITKEIGGILYE